MQALQDLLPGREKVEKALLLGQAADYICQLQVSALHANTYSCLKSCWKEHITKNGSGHLN